MSSIKENKEKSGNIADTMSEDGILKLSLKQQIASEVASNIKVDKDLVKDNKQGDNVNDKLDILAQVIFKLYKQEKKYEQEKEKSSHLL